MTTTPSTPTEPRTDIGIFVRQLRQLLGLTQAQFAMQLKVAVPTLARWENQRTQPSPLALMQLKNMLHEMKESPIKFHRICAPILFAEYFDEEN